MSETWETSMLECPHCGSTHFWSLTGKTKTHESDTTWCCGCNREVNHYHTQRLTHM